MKQGLYTIESLAPIAKDTFRLTLRGQNGFTRPGQFAQLDIPGLFLRRPLSVCDFDETGFSTIFKVVGSGTKKLAQLRPGDALDCLTGLGNGFDISRGARALLLGGGVGVPPLYGLAKRLAEKGARPRALLGFGSEQEVFYKDEFERLGCAVSIATVCDSCYTKGLVTDLIPPAGGYDFYYACGPEPMLQAVESACRSPGQLSLESRMACGFGACMGCSKKTADGGYKRVCTDGPVFESGEVQW